MSDNRFSSHPALVGLKDFQRKTVDYLFHRFYGPDPTTRFLVADEVGLGKTLVARGIIAKTIEHLQDKVDRVDVIYVCSNAAIAKQNVDRLNVSGSAGFSIATRLTYLPEQVKSLRKNRVNFISLTPRTALDHTRSRDGHADERVILYVMLLNLLSAKNKPSRGLHNGLLNMLQGKMRKDNWRSKARDISAKDLDANLSKAFRKAVQEETELYSKLKNCCKSFAHYRKKIPREDSELRYDTIRDLRKTLASVCLSALKPSLVILDEFQRFKDLLDGDNEASILANKLFNTMNKDHEVKILLLSATPYKMLTFDNETDEDDHYLDFLQTLSFLLNEPGSVDKVESKRGKVKEIKDLIAKHRETLDALASDTHYNIDTRDSMENKTELQNCLLKVMCRTERVTITRNYNAMLTEIEQSAPLKPADLDHAAMVDKIARCVKAGESIEYWKSAPYLINFLKHYELRRKLEAHLNDPSETLLRAFSTANDQLLTKNKINKYSKLDPANPRMRILFEDTIDKGMWQLLWMPPSMPYCKLAGVFAGKESLTKMLVFSSWRAVPDAIASTCSYEAERRMLSGVPVDITYNKLYDKIKPLLRFAIDSNKRPTGMPVLAWMLPSPMLATKIDPLFIALKHGGKPISSRELKEEIKTICRKLLKRMPEAVPGVRADERWYWAAPILLEAGNQKSGSQFVDWCKNEWGKVVADRESEIRSKDHQFKDHRFKNHIDLLVQLVEGKIELGPQPEDLIDVLCEMALAGPGVCALRALLRLAPKMDPFKPSILEAAVRIASGFRSRYNMPETIYMLRNTLRDTLLRNTSKDAPYPYWRLTLQYGIDGNLQSVLDEYVHVLKESLGLQDHSLEDQVSQIAEAIRSALLLRTAQFQIDEIKVSGEELVKNGFNTRCRFALRFGDIRDDDNQVLVRESSVRDAFNSPFRPFVLASTSIGQEGLDFHTWCHAVVHWNLPSNPVDLEQREGRVQRYKNHAVRKNIAEHYGLRGLALADFQGKGDPWHNLFQMASQNRSNGHCDLIPYWIFEEGSARVQRRIPLLPHSKEVAKLRFLKEGLTRYRLVFGQPRQEDLLFSFTQNDSPKMKDPLIDWLISLKPPL